MAKQKTAQQDDFFPEVGSGVENSGQFVINFENISETSFEALPAGMYNAAIDSMEIKTSKNGNPMLSIVFNVLHEDYNTRKLFAHFVLNNDISLGRLKKFLINIFPDQDLAQIDLQELCASGIGISRQAQLKVVQRPYQGSISNDVREILPPVGSEFI